MAGPSQQVSIAVIARDLGKANGRTGLRRSLWPASIWLAMGYKVDLFSRSPSRRRLTRYDALFVRNPLEAGDIRCCDDAVGLGLALIVDVDFTTNQGSKDRSAFSGISPITRQCLALATIVTTQSAAEADALRNFVPVGVQRLVLADPPGGPADSAHVRNVLRESLRRARLRSLVSSPLERLLSPRGPLALPFRLTNMVRSIPRSWWLNRIPRALARRFLTRFSRSRTGPTSAFGNALHKSGPSEEYSFTGDSASDLARRFAPQIDRALSEQQWADIMERALKLAAESRLKDSPRKLKILMVMDLIQDLDVLLPIVDRMRIDDRFSVTVAITDWLDRVSPRVSTELFNRSVAPLIITKKDAIEGSAPDLSRVDALITACETNHPAHRVPHAIVRRANDRSIPTYTLQHGLENIALTYFEPYADHDGPIEIASSEILTWGPVEKLPADVSPSIRARCFAVGTSKPRHINEVKLPLSGCNGPVIGIFENLHWERYTDSYRQAFINDLLLVAQFRETTTFVLKPHHAGMYLSKNSDRLSNAPRNIILADPSTPPWEAFTASAIIGSVDAVITTPSTVALDAALADRAVAVAGYGLELPVYEPLPILTNAESWLTFIDQATAGTRDFQSRIEEFRTRHVFEGDAVGRILDRVAEIDVVTHRGKSLSGG